MASGVEPSPNRPPRPAFVEGWPSHPELDALVAAFVAGNYARVRDRASRLAANANAPPEVRRAAAELNQRIRPEPWVLTLLGACVALLLGVAAWT